MPPPCNTLMNPILPAASCSQALWRAFSCPAVAHVSPHVPDHPPPPHGRLAHTNCWTGPRFGPASKRIFRFKGAGTLRISGQTDSGQLVFVKSAADGPRLANKTNKSGQRRTVGVLSGVPEGPISPAFLRGPFAKRRDSARFGVQKADCSRLPATISFGLTCINALRA